MLNFRTQAMLRQAAELFGGQIDVAETVIQRGSDTIADPLSFGTYAGGGVVDIYVIDKGGERWVLLYEEIPELIQAMRVAGFAAWLRDFDQPEDGSPIHIHAVAKGG